jgi:uncharacterized protein YaeQ
MKKFLSKSAILLGLTAIAIGGGIKDAAALNVERHGEATTYLTTERFTVENLFGEHHEFVVRVLDPETMKPIDGIMRTDKPKFKLRPGEKTWINVAFKPGEEHNVLACVAATRFALTNPMTGELEVFWKKNVNQICMRKNIKSGITTQMENPNQP